MRGDSGVAGKGRVVGIPKFYSWGMCTMPLTNIESDWMSNASYGLCIILGYIILYYVIYAGYLRGSIKLHLGMGCNEQSKSTLRCTLEFRAAGLP